MRALIDGRRIGSDAFPVAVPVGMHRQPHVGARNQHAVDHEISAQQREQADAELRAAPRHHGLGAEARRIAETAIAGAQCEPRKEAEIDVAGECELASRRITHRGFDLRLESIRIDEPDDQQHADDGEGEDRTEAHGNPFEDQRTRPTL